MASITIYEITPPVRALLLKELQEGKIFFLNWKKKSFIAKGIKAVEWFKYNLGGKKKWDVDKTHSSILIGMFTPQGKIINRLIHLEAINRGVTPNSFTWSLGHSDVEYVDLYELIIPDNVDRQRVLKAVSNSYELAWGNVNKPYGFFTIASILGSTALASMFGHERVIRGVKRIGLADWFADKMKKNNICSQFNTIVANEYLYTITGENFISDRDAFWVDPEAFESLTDKLIHRYRIIK